MNYKTSAAGVLWAIIIAGGCSKLEVRVNPDRIGPNERAKVIAKLAEPGSKPQQIDFEGC